MHWVLQDNLYKEYVFNELLDQLERQDVPYTVVKVVPFVGELIPDINIEGPVLAIGATTMSKISKRKGWRPGYFDENLDMRNLLHHYGNRMLNKDAVVKKLGELEHVWDHFHIRPILDSKSFSGQVMDWYEFEEWRDKIRGLEAENSYTSLTLDDYVMMSPLKEIWAEYRFHIIDRKIVSGCQYKRGTIVKYDSLLPIGIETFVSGLVSPISTDSWCPNEAFALDIADTPDGWKVIEINSINSAGLYALDMGKFVHAMEDLYRNRLCQSDLE